MNKTWPYSQETSIHVGGNGRGKGSTVHEYGKEMLGTEEKVRKLQGVLTLNSAFIHHLPTSRVNSEGDIRLRKGQRCP